MLKIQEKMENIFLPELSSSVYSSEVELLCSYGGNSLAFPGLFPQNRHFLTPGRTGLVNYRVMNRVAVVLGDPICAPEVLERVVRSFLDFCAQRGWNVAFYQTSSEHLSIYQSLGMRAFKMGEEAMLNPQSFTLSGSALANVRTSARRAEREGVDIRWYEGVPPVEAMQHLEAISQSWLENKAGKGAKGAAETGFSTGRLDEVTESAFLAESIASSVERTSSTYVPRFVTAIVTTRAGRACAFMTFTPVYGSSFNGEARLETQGWGYSLDLMRRTPDAPPGVTELVLVEVLKRFQPYGAQVISLGLVALSDTNQEMTPRKRHFLNVLIDRLHLLKGRQTLFKFKQKFHPCWQSRYIVISSTLALPQIALAIFRLRNYSGSVAGLMHNSEKE